MNVQFFFSSIFLNHSKVLAEFFHWLTHNSLIKCWFIFSEIDLLILPSSLLEGFIKRQGKLDWKLSLWSFKVVKAGVLVRDSILSPSWVFFAMFFASILIAFSERSVDFLLYYLIIYYLVILSFNSLLFLAELLYKYYCFYFQI